MEQITPAWSRRTLFGSAAALALAGRDAVAQERRPNIVLILVDDLDARSVARMPNVAALIGEQGTVCSRFFCTTPLCGPSRASLLRGQYAHNHGVLENGGDTGGFATFQRLGRETSTLATWLRGAGYATALFGKYLNGYPGETDPAHVPPGWDEWHAFVYGAGGEDSDFYFDYALNQNGTVARYGHDPADYSTDVLASLAANFVHGAAGSAQPFFAFIAPHAPHEPATPAPRHAAAAVEPLPPAPSFGEADVADKPGYVRESPRLDAETIAGIERLQTERLRTLLAVDDLVGRIIDTLSATGQIDRTYLLFTSDNGFLAGEHRQPHGKLVPYEEASRVPLLARGPGVTRGRDEDRLALNIDLAATCCEIAGVVPPDFVDGRSLLPLLTEGASAAWRGAVLLEGFKEPRARKPGRTVFKGSPAAPPYRALRTPDRLYVEYDGGERELYDLDSDPNELENLIAESDPGEIALLAARLAALQTCQGNGCRLADK